MGTGGQSRSDSWSDITFTLMRSCSSWTVNLFYILYFLFSSYKVDFFTSTVHLFLSDAWQPCWCVYILWIVLHSGLNALKTGLSVAKPSVCVCMCVCITFVTLATYRDNISCICSDSQQLYFEDCCDRKTRPQWWICMRLCY